MPVYEVESGGTTFEVEAPDIKKAQSAARLMIARQRMTRRAEEGAETRKPPAALASEEARARLEAVLRPEGGSPPQPQPYMGPQTKNLPQAATHLNAAALATLGLPALVRNPVATAKALVGGVAGSALGSEAGQWVGHRVPIIGGETAGKVAGTVGGLVGGGVGATVGPKIGGRQLANLVTGGRFGTLLGAAESKPVSAATSERLKIMAQRATTAAKDAESRRIKAMAYERKVTLAEQRAVEQAGKLAQATAKATGQPVAVSPATAAAPAVVPATTGIPVPAAPEETIVLKLQQQMKTAAGRKVVREWLNQQPKEVASQIRLLLARGQAHPGTVAGGGTVSAGASRAAGLGEELARMLGQ